MDVPSDAFAAALKFSPARPPLRAEYAACRLFIEQMNKLQTASAISHGDSARDHALPPLRRLRHFDRFFKPADGQAPAAQRKVPNA